MVETPDLKKDAAEELKRLCVNKGIKFISLNLLNNNCISFIKDKDVILFSVNISADRIHRFITDEFKI